MKNTILAALVVLSLAFPVVAAIYAPSHTFVPGEQIKSSLFNQMQTDISLACGAKAVVAGQLGDSCVETSKLGADCVGNFAMQDASIKAEQMNYTDSSLWDTMPVRFRAGGYTGDSNADTGYRISCGGLRPIRVEVMEMTLGSSARFTFDVRWDTTTACYAEYSDTRMFSDTSAGAYGLVRITKGDTEFVVYNVRGGTHTPNIISRKYAWSAWGY